MITHKFDPVHYWIAVAVEEREVARREPGATVESLVPYTEKIDFHLQGCKDPECSFCGELVCPHHDPMHFHHDGCPSCSQEDDHAPTDHNGGQQPDRT